MIAGNQSFKNSSTSGAFSFGAATDPGLASLPNGETKTALRTSNVVTGH